MSSSWDPAGSAHRSKAARDCWVPSRPGRGVPWQDDREVRTDRWISIEPSSTATRRRRETPAPKGRLIYTESPAARSRYQDIVRPIPCLNDTVIP